MADIGYVSQVLALVVTVYAAAAYAVGFRRGRADISLSARNGVLVAGGFLTMAVGVLLYALVTRDFRIEYVASYTDRGLSMLYTVAAVWAGSRGSLLFWAWVLSLFAIIVVLQKRDAGKQLVPYAAMVTMIVQAFFLVMLLTVNNPFAQLDFTPPDGMGLNPLLENPGMLLHPPGLLVGYVGFTIPFAFAISALLTGSLGDEWLVASRRWAIIAWLILGVGNLAGSWWAYYVLGWGGMWAWDPVENAGLLPWLVGTAFLHSAMMQRRRGILKRWNMVLVILAFVLSIFGTFLTRSGVLGSVHTFSESILGPFFLIFIGITLLGSFLLVRYRQLELKAEAEIESVLSRESTFLVNNLLLVCGTFAIFLGTVFPLMSEAVRGVKITVGPPFYNQVMAPIFLGIIFLTGVCTVIGWRRASARNLMRNFLYPLVAALVLAAGLFIWMVREWYILGAIAICAFVVFTIFWEWIRGTSARHKLHRENYLSAFTRLIMSNRPRYGGYLVHISIVLIAVGIIASSAYDVSKEVTLKRGESVSIQNYTLTYKAVDTIETQSKVTYSSTLAVQENGRPIGQIIPQKYVHRNHENPVTVAAVRSTLLNDLYVILIGWDEDGSASFKVIDNPLMNWVWIGSVLMIVGALLAFWPARGRPELTTGQRSDNE